MITVKRVLTGDAQDDLRYIVLEGSIDGMPQLTHRRTISAAAIASGDLNIADEKAALVATVQQHYDNWQAAQAALNEL